MTEPYITCKTCGALDIPQFLFKKWGYDIYFCGVCGTGFTVIDSDLTIEDLYNKEYFQGGRRDGYVDYLGSENILKREYKKLLSELTRHSLPGGRLLEIGCAFGFFLSEALSFYDCFGLELSAEAARYAVNRGFKEYNQSPDQDLLKKIGPFDVVVLLDVLEHIINPTAIIQLIRENINQNGILLITTGNFSSIYSRISKKKMEVNDPSPALTFFH